MFEDIRGKMELEALRLFEDVAKLRDLAIKIEKEENVPKEVWISTKLTEILKDVEDSGVFQKWN